MSNFNETHIVCIKLLQKNSKAYEYATILKYIFELVKDKKYNFDNDFIELLRECIISQLFLEIAKMFDAANSYKGDENCSLYRLEDLCKEDKHFINKQSVINEKFDKIKKMYRKCDTIKDARNKIIAHNDLKEIFTFEREVVMIEDILNLIEEINNLLSYIFKTYFGLNITSIKKSINNEYKKSICSILNIEV